LATTVVDKCERRPATGRQPQAKPDDHQGRDQDSALERVELGPAQVGDGEQDHEGDEGQLPVERRAVPEAEVRRQSPAGEDEDGERGERSVAEASRDGA
jgi:hypothetical protein